jgi:RHS repeat-associated protein
MTDALGRATAFDRDAIGRVLSQTYPDAAVASFGWDGNSNLTSVTPPGRPAHGQGFTPVDLMSSYTPPVVPGVPSPATTYQYNADRQLTHTSRPDGLAIDRFYDSAGRLDFVTQPDGTLDHDYFGLAPPAGGAPGRLSRIVSTSGVALDFTYDGRLQTSTTWSGPVSGSVVFTYDNDFRVATETVTVGATASTVSFGYDADSLLVCASQGSCSPPDAGALTVSYDPLNGLLLGSSLGSVTDAYTYDAHGELASYTARFGGTDLFRASYDEPGFTRDALGRITRKTETLLGETHTYEYAYHARGWLTDVVKDGVLVEHYEYDANGNRVLFESPTETLTGVYDDQDRLLSYGPFEYTYTANGELRTKTDTRDGSVTTYGYDVRGNLVRVELPSGDVIEYLIDGMDRRVGKKKNGVLERVWVWRDKLRIAAELDGGGSVVARYVYGAGGGTTPDYVVRGSDLYRVVGDHLGSVRAAANVANGADVPVVLQYTAFGEASGAGSGWMAQGFAGALDDVDSALLRFGVRDYDPTVGRWLAKDPWPRNPETNAYLHALNDPVNDLDPAGKQSCKSCLATLAASVAACYYGCPYTGSLAEVCIAGCVLGISVLANECLAECLPPPPSGPPPSDDNGQGACEPAG